MSYWADEFKINPIPSLLSSGNAAIEYFLQRDLLDDNVPNINILWELDEPRKLLKKQDETGFWEYPGKKREEIRSRENYNQLETYRNLSILVEKYGFNRSHPAVQMSAAYLFNYQTDEGDFRGIYANQYATTYTPALMEILIKAGYENDPHIEKGFSWLLSQRQDDGGWAIPLRTQNIKYKEAVKLQEPVQRNASKPFSHLVTGMVLRAFAAHPDYRNSKAAQKAANLLASRLFKPDKYPDRRDKKYWERVSFPFWFTDILTALDSLYFTGCSKDNPHVQVGMDFLMSRQKNSGLYDLKIVRGRDKDLKYWIGLVVCRIFKRFHEL